MIVDTVLISHCKTENPSEQKYDLISALSRWNLSKRDVHELYCIDRTQNKKHTSASCLRNPRFLIRRKNSQPLFIAITCLGSYRVTTYRREGISQYRNRKQCILCEGQPFQETSPRCTGRTKEQCIVWRRRGKRVT